MARRSLVAIWFSVLAWVLLGRAWPSAGTDEATARAVAAQMERIKVKVALKQYSIAVKELHKLSLMDPRDPEIPNLAGIVYLQNRQYAPAEAYFKKALKIDKNFARAYNNLGAVYHVRKHHRLAVRQYKKAVEKDPAFLLAYYNMSNAYFAMGKSLQAVDCMHQLVRLDPEYLLKDHPGVEIGGGEIDTAKKYFYYAKLYAQAGQADKALLFLQKAIAAGYKDYKAIIADQDFHQYNEDPRFQALVFR